MRGTFVLGVIAAGSLLCGCDIRARIKADAEKVEHQLRRELRYAQIAVGGAPMLVGESPVSDYALTLAAPVEDPYLFRLKEYVIATGGDESKIPTASICSTIDSLKMRNSLGKSLRDIDLKIEVSPTRFGFSLGGKAATFAELFLAISEFADIDDAKLLIAVRGYADGQHSAWSDTLRGPPYDYERIDVLPPVDPRSLNPVTFLFQDSSIYIPSRVYTNAMLPDLRAEFVKRELIVPFLQQCSYDNVEVRVIKGFEYSTPDEPLNRKVQVYVYVFEK